MSWNLFMKRCEDWQKEFNCCVWTASQTNRSGLNAEVITRESIAEAYNKCFVSDFIVSLSITVEDKQSNTGRIFVAKNRNGPDGLVFPVSMHTSKCTNRSIAVHWGRAERIVSQRSERSIEREI